MSCWSAGTAVGVATLPVFLLGIPVLAGVFALGRLFARAERARLAFFLGASIPAARPPQEPVWWRRMLAPMRSAAGWRYLGYALVRVPLSVVQVVVLTVVWSLGPVLLFLPLYDSALPGGRAHLGGYPIHSPWQLTVAVLLGAAVLLAAPQVTYALAAADVAVGPRVVLEAGSGDITVSGLASADVTASDGSGNITLTFTKIPRRVTVSASSGDVRLVLPRGRTLYQVHAIASSGNTVVRVPRSSVSPYVINVNDGSGNIFVTN